MPAGGAAAPLREARRLASAAALVNACATGRFTERAGCRGCWRSIAISMPRQSSTVIIAEPPIGDQRQRDADHRREAHHHHQVDRDVEEDRRGQARRGRAGAKRRLRAQRDADPPARSPSRRRGSAAAADQAPFLGHRREDEIGMALGQIVEMALRAVEEALAEDAARSDRDLRLGDVIAGAERVAFRDRGRSATRLR